MPLWDSRNGACLLAISFFAFWMGCSVTKRTAGPNDGPPSFYIAGHRGAAGLMPEETIPAMKKGIEAGANTLECDLYVTRDGNIVLHHDPSFNPDFETMPDGSDIPRAQRDAYTLYKMNYADIRRFIVGEKRYAVFPERQRIKTYLPLLTEMIDSVESFTRKNRLRPVCYMPEIEAWPGKVGISNPTAEEFAAILMKTLKPYLPRIKDRLIIQCFSVRPLQILHHQYPSIALAFLTGNKNRSFQDNIAELGFVPAFYLPYSGLVTPALIKECHDNHTRIIPWTVDDTTEMKKLISMGVDGMITDYPDRLAKLNK